MSVALQHASGKSDINFAFRPEDNRYLVVHECSGFEPGDAQGLHSIRNFITYRTDPSRSVWQRLHAVWLCIPVSDLLSGSIGDGVEEILAMRGVPIIVAITKFDVVVHQVLLESEYENSQHMNRTRECTSSDPFCEITIRDLIENLIAITDRLLMDSSAASTSSARSGIRGTKARIAPVPLAWSAALRVSRDIIIQTFIEVGRSRYWRSLWSSLDFAEQPLKNCVKAIHTDIVEIWNMEDRTKCLMSPEFMATMSHIVKDLAGPAGDMQSSLNPSGSGDKFAEWVQDVYRGSPENVQCIMGYIVDLTKILDDIFRTADGNVSINDVQLAMIRHVRSGQDKIHWNIRGCVTHAFATRHTAPGKDMILEKIIELIEK
ncbi:hypothetical protein BJV74DRAFT_954554 [Russula compacta]|nr:hypothetical protein BJV74DRAFT_954554 [Russula compacta]